MRHLLLRLTLISCLSGVLPDSAPSTVHSPEEVAERLGNVLRHWNTWTPVSLTAFWGEPLVNVECQGSGDEACTVLTARHAVVGDDCENCETFVFHGSAPSQSRLHEVDLYHSSPSREDLIAVAGLWVSVVDMKLKSEFAESIKNHDKSGAPFYFPGTVDRFEPGARLIVDLEIHPVDSHWKLDLNIWKSCQ